MGDVEGDGEVHGAAYWAVSSKVNKTFSPRFYLEGKAGIGANAATAAANPCVRPCSWLHTSLQHLQT